MESTTVRQLMSTELISIDRHLKINHALELMRSEGVRRLPVVTEIGRVIGMITEKDVLLAMAKMATIASSDLGADPMRDSPLIHDVMADFVHTVAPERSIAHAAKLMSLHKISGLPVIEDGVLVGMLSESDIFNLVVQVFEQEKALVAA